MLIEFRKETENSAQENISCPVLVCDGCGKQIHDAGKARAYYRLPTEGNDVGVWFCHTEPSCEGNLELKVGRQQLRPLALFLTQLFNNSGFTPETMQEQLNIIKSRAGLVS